MDFGTFIAFVVASAAFIAIPGPNVALICSDSIAHGLRYGLLTVIGVGIGAALQLFLVVIGTGTLLTYVSDAFEWLRWLGVAYLLYLGIRSWNAVPEARTAAPASLGRSVFLRSLLISLTNAHTLLFFGAFLPQFVDPARDPVVQLAILAATYSVIGLVLDAIWAVAASRMGRAIAAESRFRNRLTGALLIASAAALALSHRIA